MIELDVRHLTALRGAGSAEELHGIVQKAVELEFATIPPYLTAMMSLHIDDNREIWDIVHSVVIDEMLHMLITCNLLIALGGKPVIDSAQFIPPYPCPLPMAIHTGLAVGLEPFSPELVERTFMGIEQPEEPLILAAAEGFPTIGEFYEALKTKLHELGDDAFQTDPVEQLTDLPWFPAQRLFPITDVASAVNAVDLIVLEGEGTAESPAGEPGEIAHFYRFQQIVKGRRLVADSAAPAGFSFTGPVIPFETTAVWPVTPNQKLRDLDPDSQAGRRARQFAYTFTKLLRALHDTFNGHTDAFDSAMSVMFELKLAGQMLCATPAVFAGRPTGRNAGPAFEYMPEPS